MTLPNIRINAQVPFPSLVKGSGPITLTKTSGIWTVALDFIDLPVLATVDLTHKFMLVYDNVTGSFLNTSVANLLGLGLQFNNTASTTALVNGNNNNVPLPTPAGTNFARITGPSGAFTITGVAAGQDGQELRLYNTTAQNMTIANSSASSTAGNRILTQTGADMTVVAGGVVTLKYDVTAGFWFVLSYSNVLLSPSFIGTPTAPTAAAGTNTTQLATTAFVETEIANLINPNLIINGGMEVSQFNGASAVAAINGYLVDQWGISNVGTQVVTGQQVVDAPPGFEYSIKATVTTANAAPGASDVSHINTRIEGYRTARLGFGAAGASQISIGFWVKANRTGTYSGAIRNNSFNRSYPFNFTINVSATWEYKTITIPGDVTGTWLTTNGIGFTFNITLMSGSSLVGTANTWAASNFVGVTGTINGVASVTDYMQVTGVSLIPGAEPVSSAMSPAYVLPFDMVLELCQRYYEKSFDYATIPAQNVGNDTGEWNWVAVSAGATTNRSPRLSYKVRKRAAATLTYFNPAAANANVRDETVAADCGAVTQSSNTEAGVRVQTVGAVGTVVGDNLGIHWVADARL